MPLGSDPAGLTPSLALDAMARATNSTVIMGSDPQGLTPHPGQNKSALDIIFTVIRLPNHIRIAESELEEQFVCSSGPGGQNVNKVATAVELRFDVRRSPTLPEPVRLRLERLAGRRLTKDGVLVIRADRFRTQEQNRVDARARLADLIRRAAVPPKARIKTKPTRAAKERRLKAKVHRSLTKRTRQSKPSLE